MPNFTTAAAYAADARARATAAGAPIARADFPGLMLTPHSYLYLAHGDVMIAPRRGTGRPIEAEDLVEFIDYENAKDVEPLTWLCADRRTRAQLLDLAKELGVEAQRPLSYQFAPLTKLEAQRLPVLTDALARKLWAPEAVDTTSLASWCAALGIAAGSIRQMMDEASKKALHSGLGGPIYDFAYNQAMAAARSESRIMDSFGYSGTASSVTSLRLMGDHADITGGIMAMDPGLSEMNRVSGLACRLQIEATEADSEGNGTLVTGEVSMPMKFKQDRSVRVISPTGVGEAHIIELFASGHDTLSVTLRMTNGARNKTSVAAGETVYLTNHVFSMRRPKIENRRWMGHDKIERVPRQMPLAVRAAASANRPTRSARTARVDA